MGDISELWRTFPTVHCLLQLTHDHPPLQLAPSCLLRLFLFSPLLCFSHLCLQRLILNACLFLVWQRVSRVILKVVPIPPAAGNTHQKTFANSCEQHILRTNPILQSKTNLVCEQIVFCRGRHFQRNWILPSCGAGSPLMAAEQMQTKKANWFPIYGRAALIPS